jgi:hypothetical protein
MIPSTIVSEFWPAWNVLPLRAWAAIGGASGGIGMAISYSPRSAAFAGGVVAGVCIPFALVLYVFVRSKLSDTFWSLEFIIPGVLGAIPGIGVYKLICASVVYSDDDPMVESVDRNTEAWPPVESMGKMAIRFGI